MTLLKAQPNQRLTTSERLGVGLYQEMPSLLMLDISPDGVYALVYAYAPHIDDFRFHIAEWDLTRNNWREVYFAHDEEDARDIWLIYEDGDYALLWEGAA